MQNKSAGMQIGYYQFNPEFGDKDANLGKIIKAIGVIDCDLLVCPELCTTGYQFDSHSEVESLSESIPDGPTCRTLMQTARETGKGIICGIAEKDGSHYYNSAIFAGPEGYIGRYRKIHLFDEETLWFQAGNERLRVYSFQGALIGIMICFDWIFPEAARSLALLGAEVICHPANLILPYCQDAMITRAIENRVYIVTANRWGAEQRGNRSRLQFTGRSQIVNPKGERLCQAAPDCEQSDSRKVPLDLAHQKKIMTHSHLFHQRRPAMYHLS